jgi:hypothetical protein
LDIDPFGLVDQGQGGFQIACGLFQFGLVHMPAVKPIRQGGLQTQFGGSFQVMSGEGVISTLTVDHGQAEMMVGSDVFGLRAVLGGQLQGILIGLLGLTQAPQAHQQIGYSKGAGNHEQAPGWPPPGCRWPSGCTPT